MHDKIAKSIEKSRIFRLTKNITSYIIKLTSPPGLCRHPCGATRTLGSVLFIRGMIMADKEFKSIEDQISILESRGLQIPDRSVAADFLLRNNYYRVSGYSLTLRNHDVFTQNANFQNIIDIYEFDHNLRHILLKYIELIEVTVKSVYSYEFTKVYGATGQYAAVNFTDAVIHADIMQKAEIQKNTRLQHEAYLKHFVNELQQDIPLWAFVDLLTISNVSFLYKISQPAIKLAVAYSLGLTTRGDELLEQFMHHITIIRNLCAHGSRLYNRLFEQRPWLSRKEKALLIQLPDGTADNAHLYGFILVMRRLLKPEEFSSMKAELIALSRKYPFVSLRYYGFRDDWETAL